MKNQKFKIISIFLCLVVFLGNIPLTVNATETTELLFVADDNSYSNLISELNNPTIIVDESQIDACINSDIDISESIIVNFDLFDYTSTSNISESMLNNYKAIALPVTNKETESIARTAHDKGILLLNV